MEVGSLASLGSFAVLSTGLVGAWVKLRKMNIDERLALRAGDVGRITDLEEENRAQRNEMAAMRTAAIDAAEKCREETERLHDMVMLLKEEIAGMRAQLRQYQLSEVQVLGNLTPPMERAVEQLNRLT